MCVSKIRNLGDKKEKHARGHFVEGSKSLREMLTFQLMVAYG